MSAPLVVIVAPEKPRNVHEREQHRQLEELRKLVQQAAEARGWRTRTYRTQKHSSTRPAENGRSMFLLGGWDAADIYSALHRGEVAVLQMGKTARVLPHPRQEPSRDRTVTLEDFVRHKAFFATVNSRGPFQGTFDHFQTSLERVECDGERDPRCLPMHVFAPAHDHHACPLTEASSVKKAYGPPNALKDPHGRPWARPKGRHGGEAMRIRGADIPAGFHWDVGSVRNESELTTTVEIWRLPSGSYVNIAPNAVVRKGQSSARATATRTVCVPRTSEARQAKPGQAPVGNAAKRSSRGRRR